MAIKRGGLSLKQAGGSGANSGGMGKKNVGLGGHAIKPVIRGWETYQPFLQERGLEKKKNHGEIQRFISEDKNWERGRFNITPGRIKKDWRTYRFPSGKEQRKDLSRLTEGEQETYGVTYIG